MKNLKTYKILTIGVLLEERFYQTADGAIYSPSGFGDSFWQRYLSCFDRVVIIARLAPTESVDAAWAKLNDTRVSINGVYSFVGPLQFLLALPKVLLSFNKACNVADALIVRAPGTLSLLVLQLVRRPIEARKPVAVELVGDPVDVFGAGVGGRLRGLLKYVFKYATMRLCAKADAVSYVTQRVLQTRYPPHPGVFSIACSSVELPRIAKNDDLRRVIRPFSDARLSVTFTAASLEVPYKGIDVLIKATALLVEMGHPVLVRIAGDGRLRPALEGLAKRLGVADLIVFLGRLDRNAVLDEMRSADLYVQPSLTEGLPRAVIEACSTAAPVVASRIGGIPELLDAEDMVTPGDSRALAMCIMETLIDPERMAAMSARNLATAHEYDSEVLDARRQTFYRELRRILINGGGN